MPNTALCNIILYDRRRNEGFRHYCRYMFSVGM